MLPLLSTAQRVSTMECAPCALRRAMQRHGLHEWTPPLADFAVDMVAGAIALADATEVLVPSSLVHFMEQFRETCSSSSSAWPWPAWDAALQEQKLVTWIRAEDAVPLLHTSYGAAYNNLCVPVPAGPLVSKLDFGTPMDVFYREVLPALLDAVSAASLEVQAIGEAKSHHCRRSRTCPARWRAWMRAALTCAYEGTHVPPIRVSDYTSQLLRQEDGCQGVVWEASVRGLTPRWLETATKTALAVGVSSSSLTLALPEEASATSRLLAKSVEVGITSWTTCALTQTPLHARAAAMATPQSVRLFTTGWNEVSHQTASACCASSEREEALRGVETSLARCADFVDAVQDRVATLLPEEEPPDLKKAAE